MHRTETKSNPAPTEASVPVMAWSRCSVWLLAVLLMLVTLALYWPALSHDFVDYDDQDYVTSNAHVQSGLTLESIKWAFSSPVVSNWHPLTMLSHMLDCQLYGLKPWGHHLTSVLLHAVNTVLVFLFLRGLTGAKWRSMLVAAVFGFHPLHVESVAWVAERKDVLSTLFWMLTLWTYALHVEKSKGPGPRSKVFYVLALFFFMLGLMSKAMLVTLPFVLLLLDYWPLERFKPGQVWQLVREKIPFFALAAVASVVAYVEQQHSGAMKTVEALPLGERAGNALISYCRYLGKLFWPTDLAIFYPHPGYWPLGEVLLAAALLLGLSVLFYVQRVRHPCLLMGWLWYAGTLVPVIGLVQVGGQSMADRYAYIPSIGLLVMIIWGLYELTQRWRYHELVLSVAGCAAIVLCLGLTRQQLGYWRDSEALFRHALEVTENNYLAHYNLGAALDKKGQIDEAISQYREAIRLKSNYVEAHNNLGTDLGKQGQTDEAFSQFEEAIRLKPDYADAHYNLGVALGMKGQIDEAISQFQEAIRQKPDFAEAHNNLGSALLMKGQIDEAIRQFQEAIRLKPDYADARHNLARVLEMKNAPASH
jgi:tetratricopeptide (TPR) repeat protein